MTQIEVNPGIPDDKNVNETSIPAHDPVRTTVWHTGDARNLPFVASRSIDLIVTSPPYWKRRDYGHPNQLGQEETPEAYIRTLVDTINSWDRILKPASSIFLNLGDSYADGFLVGIPAQFEVEIRKAGWKIANQIVWTKTIGMPEPNAYRLASRHEPIYHLTRAHKPTDYYFDIHALSEYLGRTANPGDAWEPTSCTCGENAPHPQNVADDVWPLYPTRSRSGHIAPFPPELARRAILLACPERVCTHCGTPYRRRFEATADLDTKRPQAARALVLFREAGLTDEHLAAIRAVGISDAGKGQQIQTGAGKNTERVRELASEAKAALGGYFREFTFAPKRHVGWTRCSCGAPTRPGTTLDPFMGSGTTLHVAQALGRNAVGVDLLPPETIDVPATIGIAK